MCSRVGGGVSDAPPGLSVQGEEAERPLLGGEGADPPTSRGHCECTPGTGEENKCSIIHLVLHCNENPIYLFLFSPNFHHVSLSDIFRIRPHISCSRIVRIYKSLTDTCMWKLGLWPCYSFSGNICYQFSVLVLCSVEHDFYQH